MQDNSNTKSRSSGFYCPFSAMQRIANVPAEVWCENVEAFIFGQQRMEGASIRSIDDVAFFRCPEFQFASKQHIISLTF